MIPTIRTVVNVRNDNQAIRAYTLGQYLTSQIVPDHVNLEHDLTSVLQEQKRKELIASNIQDAGDYFMAYWLETCPGNLESRKRPLHAKIKAWIKQNLEEFNALDFPFSGRSKAKTERARMCFGYAVLGLCQQCGFIGNVDVTDALLSQAIRQLREHVVTLFDKAGEPFPEQKDRIATWLQQGIHQ